MPSSCLECSGMLAIFGRRRPRAPPPREQTQPKTTRLHRAFGRIKNGHRRRRAHRASSFSSVRAVFWPLMSMGSDADRASDIAGATADQPPRSSADSAAVRAPSPSLDDTPASGAGAASTTAARVLAIQAQLALDADADADASTAAAARLLALQARLGGLALASPETKTKPPILAEPFGRTRLISSGGDDSGVEEACRGFERQLMEMLVEEGKVGDLTDVEELLGCWEKLSSPDFVAVVGRFYGDLCVDLSSGLGVDVSSESSSDGSARLT